MNPRNLSTGRVRDARGWFVLLVRARHPHTRRFLLTEFHRLRRGALPPLSLPKPVRKPLP